MACTRTPVAGQTLVQRISQVDQALARLRKYLATGTVKVKVGPTGSIVFEGWNDRDFISDTCAYRSLMAEGSVELRTAVARAEALAGRKVNPQAIAAGHHSHDGGGSWHGGH